MKINGGITLSLGRSDDRVGIRLHDKDAGIAFADLTLAPEDFVLALRGVYCVPCEIDLRGLSKLGLVEEFRDLFFLLPVGVYGSENAAEAARIALEHTPDGWKPDTAFASQDSFRRNEDGTYTGKTKIRRWVPKGDGDNP